MKTLTLLVLCWFSLILILLLAFNMEMWNWNDFVPTYLASFCSRKNEIQNFHIMDMGTPLLSETKLLVLCIIKSSFWQNRFWSMEHVTFWSLVGIWYVNPFHFIKQIKNHIVSYLRIDSFLILRLQNEVLNVCIQNVSKHYTVRASKITWNIQSLNSARSLVEVSLKFTFGFNGFPSNFCHMKFPGRLYWHTDFFDQCTHFTLSTSTMVWKPTKIQGNSWAFLNSKPNGNRQFQSNELDGGPGHHEIVQS
jgi:hypothetical protein